MSKKSDTGDAETDQAATPAESDKPSRRSFASRVAGAGMAGGLIAGYGMFARTAGRYLYPSEGAPRTWMFVSEVSAIEVGAALSFLGPKGESIAIARRGQTGGAEDFVALSTVCPHLGCQVFWEGDQDRFFCPCHNGAFDANGKGIGGPPAKAGQSLASYPLRVERGILYIEVPEADRTAGLEPSPGGDAIALAQGHDPCLYPLRKRKKGQTA